MNFRKLFASLHFPIWIKSHARHKTLFTPMPRDSPCIQLTLSTYAHSFGSTHPSPWDAITPPTWGEAHQKVIRQGGNTTSFLSGS